MRWVKAFISEWHKEWLVVRQTTSKQTFGWTPLSSLPQIVSICRQQSSTMQAAAGVRQFWITARRHGRQSVRLAAVRLLIAFNASARRGCRVAYAAAFPHSMNRRIYGCVDGWWRWEAGALVDRAIDRPPGYVSQVGRWQDGMTGKRRPQWRNIGTLLSDCCWCGDWWCQSLSALILVQSLSMKGICSAWKTRIKPRYFYIYSVQWLNALSENREYEVYILPSIEL